VRREQPSNCCTNCVILYNHPSPTQRSATVVHVRIATSLISSAQALVNLRRELRPKKGFDAVALDAKMVWNRCVVLLC
jgi:putative alpha-1,2-mannosidase